MRHPTLALVLLSFAAGSLLHCELGAPVDASETPSDTTVFRSGTRLQAIVWESQDGARFPTGVWFDRELDLECEPRKAADNETRCLPTDAGTGFSWGTYFADSNCTMRLFEVGSKHGQYVSAPDRSIWARAVSVQEGDKLYKTADDSCVEATWNESRFWGYAAALGDRVMDETFALFSQRVL